MERHGNASSNSSAIVPYKAPSGVNPGGFRRGSGLGDFMSGLGGMGGGPSQEVQDLTKKLQEIKLPDETRKIVDQEI